MLPALIKLVHEKQQRTKSCKKCKLGLPESYIPCHVLGMGWVSDCWKIEYFLGKKILNKLHFVKNNSEWYFLPEMSIPSCRVGPSPTLQLGSAIASSSKSILAFSLAFGVKVTFFTPFQHVEKVVTCQLSMHDCQLFEKAIIQFRTLYMLIVSIWIFAQPEFVSVRTDPMHIY